MMRCCPLPCSPGVLPVRQAEEAQAAVRRGKPSGVSEGLLRPRAVALIFAFGFFRESHFEPAALDQGRYVLSHGEGHGFASQELREFLTGAGRFAEFEQEIRPGDIFCGDVRDGWGVRRRVVKSDNELVSPVFEFRFREVEFLHGPAHCRDTGIPVFCPGELFRHHGKRGVAQFRFRVAELFDAHSAVKAAGAVHLKTIREQIKLHGGAFRVRAVIPVD